MLTPRDNRQQLPLYADNGGALAAGTSLDVRPWRVSALILFAALVVSLTLTAAASADVSFTKAYGWGVSDGASQFETCTSTCQAGLYGSGAGQFEAPEASTPIPRATSTSPTAATSGSTSSPPPARSSRPTAGALPTG